MKLVQSPHGSNDRPAIVIDGVFFQLNNTGIARCWSELLQCWQDSDIAGQLVLIDRDKSLPKFPKLRTLSCGRFRYESWRQDRAVMQDICDSVGADLFVSTYFTRPERTRTVVLVHDMIPERFYNIQAPAWQQKHNAIRHAAGFAAVSRNTMSDLRHFFPETLAKPAIVASPGVSSAFVPPQEEERRLFRARIVLPYLEGRPYFLFVSEISTEKNAAVLLRALKRMATAERTRFGVLFTHKSKILNEFHGLPGLKVHATRLNDAGLRAAYGSALALIYPSRYEGFGLPPLEAMACGCPVICSNVASLPEVVGDAALMIDPEDDKQLHANLLRIQDETLKDELARKGIERAKNFSWRKMAMQLETFLTGNLLPA